MSQIYEELHKITPLAQSSSAGSAVLNPSSGLDIPGCSPSYHSVSDQWGEVARLLESPPTLLRPPDTGVGGAKERSRQNWGGGVLRCLRAS